MLLHGKKCKETVIDEVDSYAGFRFALFVYSPMFAICQEHRRIQNGESVEMENLAHIKITATRAFALRLHTCVYTVAPARSETTVYLPLSFLMNN